MRARRALEPVGRAAQRRPPAGRGARDVLGRRRPARDRRASTPASGRRRRPSSRSIAAMDLAGARRHPRRTRASSGSSAGLDGLAALEALTFETTLNLQGLWAGHTEPTPKTVTPAEAHARLDIRIVPDQRPADDRRGASAGTSTARLRRHRDRRSARASRAWWTPPDHPVVGAAGAGVRGGHRPGGEHRRVDGRARCRCTRSARSTGCRRRRWAPAAPTASPRAGREHPDRGPGDGHEDHGPLPRPLRAPARGAEGPLGRGARRGAPRAPRGSAPRRGPAAARRRNGRSSPRANPSAIAGSPFMNASAAASSGASNTQIPVFVRPSVGPDEHDPIPRRTGAGSAPSGGPRPRPRPRSSSPRSPRAAGG